MAKISKDDLKTCTATARDLLSRSRYRSEVVDALRDRFSLTRKQAVQIFERAFRQLKADFQDRLGANPIMFSLETYRRVLESEFASVADKIRAQARIDRLLGLEPAKKVKLQIGDLDGLSEEELRDRARQAGVPLGDEDGEADA